MKTKTENIHFEKYPLPEIETATFEGLPGWEKEKLEIREILASLTNFFTSVVDEFGSFSETVYIRKDGRLGVKKVLGHDNPPFLASHFKEYLLNGEGEIIDERSTLDMQKLKGVLLLVQQKNPRLQFEIEECDSGKAVRYEVEKRLQ